MTDLKPLAKYLMRNMTYDDYIESIRYYPTLEPHPMNPDAYAHAYRYDEPINQTQFLAKPVKVTTRQDTERTFEPADVARALGIRNFENAVVAVARGGNLVVITSHVETR